MSEKHTNPDLDGLVRFHAYAAFAHGTMLYLTFGYNVKIFGLSILDGFQAQPSILVTAPNVRVATVRRQGQQYNVRPVCAWHRI